MWRLSDRRGGALRAVFLVCAIGVTRPTSAQLADPLFTRVQQLVNAGDRRTALALADSAMQVRTPGTNAYAEALYVRAYAVSDAAAAERDYLRLSIEYPFSPRAEDAVMMVGTFRLSRGDRTRARTQFERLAHEFPRSQHVPRAAYEAGRMALDDGDLARACPLLFTASERVLKDDVELRNQIAYLRNRCMMPAPRDTARSDTAATGPVASPPAAEFSVQVAAYARKRDADALVKRLKTRGFQVRIVGIRAPYRVRIGRYPSREVAAAAQGRMRQSKVSGIVVEAEPR